MKGGPTACKIWELGEKTEQTRLNRYLSSARLILKLGSDGYFPANDRIAGRRDLS